MNPELQRNVWLELTPRRLILMAAVLGVIFLTAGANGGNSAMQAIGGAARVMYYVIVVFWGTRAAAGAVIGEIRDRTWDFQRLSALTPLEMLIGKIIGATSYQWFGGAICLAFIFMSRLAENGPIEAFAEALYFVAVGLFGQAVSLYASLIAVRKRASHTRLDVFIYQIMGLIAAASAAQLWNARFVTQILKLQWSGPGLDQLNWHGFHFPVQGFYLLSLFAFLFWALAGNLALLSSELQARRKSWTWIGFLLFMVIYVSGFAEDWAQVGQGLETVRLALAVMTAAGLTYAAILLEPKDAVTYRALFESLGRFRLGSAAGATQAWMSAFVLLTVLVAWFLFTFKAPFKEVLGYTNQLSIAVAAGYFFVARDIAIFLYFNFTPRNARGDFAAVVSLGVLYVVLPMLFGVMGQGHIMALVIPFPQSGEIGAIAAPLIEAAVMWILALARLRALARARAARI